MRASTLHFRRRPRAAFTLVELLLVMGVMLLLASIAWPSVSRSMDGYRLKRSAEDVRIELHATRTRAIESGLTYQFLVEPGGTKYLSVPAERDGPAAAHRTGIATEAVTDDLPRHFGELPAGFVFHTSTTTGEGARKLIPELLSGLADARNLAAVTWSAPIEFDPDGTGDDGHVKLVDSARQIAIPVSVRGFTGVTTVGKLEHGVAP